MQQLKIMTILGTRPEIIRLSRILPLMDKHFHHIITFTQQSYDFELSGIFFQELGLRKPDYILEVKAETIGKQIGNILEQTEKIMLQEKPDAIFILGDTNSALCAIIAKRLKIPIFHMEAGNRSFDWHVPEEINRRIVDHISDYNIAYTEHSRRYLLREGIDPDKIFVVGTPFAEIFSYYKKEIEQSKILEKLQLTPQKFFVVSTHREENVDNQNNLKELFASINFITGNYKFPVIVSVHPRTKKRLEEAKIIPHRLVQFHKPFGYFDYNKLQQNALCVLSDSGSIQEESALFGFPAIQIRVSTERPEAFDSGSIILTGFNQKSISNAIAFIVKENKKIIVPRDYQDTNISEKVVKIILGYASIRKYHEYKA